MARQCRWLRHSSSQGNLCARVLNDSHARWPCPYSTIRRRIFDCKDYLPRPVYRAPQKKERG